MRDEDTPASASASAPPPSKAFKIAVALGVVFVVTGAGGVTALVMSEHGPSQPVAVAPGGTIRMSQMTPMIAEHYRFAAAHPHAYDQVPCFCGCESMLAHRFLLDCFVRPDGGWERHASGCAVCTQESSVVRSMLADGASVRSIRDAIVSRFSSGVGGITQ
jgi:Protein of unknown function with PCYCGC motif